VTCLCYVFHSFRFDGFHLYFSLLFPLIVIPLELIKLSSWKTIQSVDKWRPNQLISNHHFSSTNDLKIKYKLNQIKSFLIQKKKKITVSRSTINRIFSHKSHWDGTSVSEKIIKTSGVQGNKSNKIESKAKETSSWPPAPGHHLGPLFPFIITTLTDQMNSVQLENLFNVINQRIARLDNSVGCKFNCCSSIYFDLLSW